MSILESALLSLCMSSSAPTNSACTNALQAASKQSGFEQMADSYEGHQTMIYEKQAYSIIGKDNAEFIGGTAWLANAVVTKKASLPLPTFGFADKVSVDINANESKLMFRWFW